MSVVLLVVGLLPASQIKNMLLTALGRGWQVARSARVTPTVLWRVGVLRVGEGCNIGPGNVLRELVSVELGDEAEIGQFNWFTAQTRYVEQADTELAGRLVLGARAAITSRHYLDCAGGIRVGEASLVAGVRSTLLTHWIDHHVWTMRAAPIVIGARSVISTCVTVTAGRTVADGCVVGAGAVVAKDLEQEGHLYVGVPARAVSDLSEAAHNDRTHSRVVSRDEGRARLREDRMSARDLS